MSSPRSSSARWNLRQPVLLVGLGVQNQAAARALVRRGHQVVLVDDQPTAAHHQLALELGTVVHPSPPPDGWDQLMRGVGAFLPTPGLPDSHAAFVAAARAARSVISEFDLAGLWDRRPLIAITGTNGKTTVTMMVTEMLRRSGIAAEAVGNTEVPLVAAIDRPAVERFVVEASSFRLGHSQHFRPTVATWLNFAPDHLDVHRDLAGYEAAKARLWRDQQPGDVAIGNLDDPVVAGHLARAGARRVGFSIRGTGGTGGAPGTGTVAGDRGPVSGCFGVRDAILHDADGVALVAVAQLPRALPHDVANALAALATAMHAGADRAAAVEVVRGWTNLAHRVELVAEAAGLRFFDDSKATTPHATLAALAGFERVVLIAGGQNKGLDLTPLRAGLAQLRAVVAIGRAGAEVAEAFHGAVPVEVISGDMDRAVAAAAALAQPGDAVMLSPACASFDAYRNYAERGEDFSRAARAWAAAHPQHPANPANPGDLADVEIGPLRSQP